MNRHRTYYEVLWSPNDSSKFITANCEDIRLFEVLSITPEGKVPPGASRLSETSAAKLLKNSDIQGIKCIDWFADDKKKSTLLAVGCESGEVSLNGFGTEHASLFNIVIKQKLPRACNDVRWHQRELQLACAFERNRGESALHLYSLNDLASEDRDNLKPHQTFAHQDAAQSVCFAYDRSTMGGGGFVILAGLGLRKIKVFDVRDSTSRLVSGNTQALYGLTVDPFNHDRLASHGNDCICIWDLRNLSQPTTTISNQHNISKLSWCPNRSNQLTAISHGKSTLSMIIVRDMHHDSDLPPCTDGYETTVMRQLQPRGNLELRSFSWHPQAEDRMLIYDSGEEITDYTIIDQITHNWSPSSEIIWTHGKTIVHRLHEKDALYKDIDPLAATVRARAVAGFGSVKDAINICDDPNLVEDDPTLLNLYFWLDKLSGYPEDLIGVYHVLENVSGSQSHPRHLPLDNANNNVKYVTTYEHEKRKRIQIFLEMIDFRGESDWAQRALLALFKLDMKKVMEYLEMPTKLDQDLNSAFVALAISGYSEQKGSTWREMCAHLKPLIKNPYLAAIFSFLMSTSDDYTQVLSSDIALQDKLFFACRFLSDLKLSKFVKDLTNEYVSKGDLKGLLLTGLPAKETGANEQLLELLQNYVDNTADVQTAAAIVVVSRDAIVLRDERSQRWIECYRGLLNQWKLWTQRALFDCAMSGSFGRAIPPQVRLHCLFCKKSISCQIDNRTRTRFPSSHTQTQRISCCPSCRKSLPRCAMCLTNMGTPSSRVQSKQPILTEHGQFERWFTWCQSCMHGGHTIHMTKWFDKHEKCPVTGCQCMCASIDGASNHPHDSLFADK